MKILVRSAVLAMGLFFLACSVHAQTTTAQNDSIQPKAVFLEKEYCPTDSLITAPVDTLSDKSWKLRIDLKNWIIQIRKDQ